MRALARFAAVAALVALPPALALRALPPPEPADLVFVSGPEPETLDPAVAARVVDLRLVSALFEPLVALDPETLEPRPAAAATWTADARGVTFTLVEGLVWSNGEPLAAEDFVRSWRRVADPATGAPFASEAAEIVEGARALDARTLRIEPRRPRPDLLSLLSVPAFAPVHLASVERHGERFARPGNLVSNGPYILAAWEPGRRLRLARSPRWRGAAAVALGSIEGITTSGGVAGGDATAFHIYETGGADLVFGVPGRAIAGIRAEGRVDLRERAGAGTFFLRFNTTRAPLNDPEVRAALAAAIDREAICKFVLRGGEEPAWSLVPRSMGTYKPPDSGVTSRGLTRTNADVSVSADDPTVFKDTKVRVSPRLSAATFSLLYPASDEAAARVGEVLQAAWKKAFGLDLRLAPAEPKTAFAAVKRLEYDIAWGSWIADYPDPVSFLGNFRTGSGNNRTGFSDAAYDALLDRAAGEAGPARLATLAAAEARLLSLAPIAPVFRTTCNLLAAPDIRGAVATPFAHTFPWARLSRSGARP